MTSFKINNAIIFDANAQMSATSFEVDNDVGNIGVFNEFQGTVAGYTSGGSATITNTIDKFPFAVDSNATDVGDLSVARADASGQSSTVSGYTSGGRPPALNTIDKFPFATNTNATDVGDLTQGRYQVAGQSSSTSGYTSGGGPPAINTIDRFPFSTNANATDVGDLTRITVSVAGQSSAVSGYTSGGSVSSPGGPLDINTIDKFPFATNANATDVGDMTVTRVAPAGQSSTVSGYNSSGAGSLGPSIGEVIDKFPFATNANATDVGNLTIQGIGKTGTQD